MRLLAPLAGLAALVVASSALAVGASAPAPKAKGEDVAKNINAPRRDARKLEFDVAEGTWMNLDVSPDGRTIVFDLLGDIYAIPADGGEAKPLTLGPAWDFGPRFSPDGTRIAFSSDRSGLTNAWVMNADGSGARAVTTSEDHYVRSPEWSPDGDWLIARKQIAVRAHIPPVELWMWHLQGGDGIQVTDKDDLNDGTGPSFSKDGRYLYFAGRQAHFSYEPDMTGGLWQIWRLDRRTGEKLPITEGYGGAIRPAASPDGRTLTFLSRRDADTVLVERDLAAGSERILMRGMSLDEQEGFSENDLYPAYSFTPDSKALILWNHGTLHRLDLATLAVTDIPFHAHVTQWAAPRVDLQVRLDDGPVQARILRWASRSADGAYVAFEAFGKVWLQALSNGKPTGTPWRVTEDGKGPAREHAPAFSPDGKQLAFVTWSDAEGGHLWKVAVAPQSASRPAPVKLTRAAGHYANPSWSPKGDRIVLVIGTGLEFRGRQPEEEGWFEAAWIPAEGGDLQVITSLKTADSLRFHPSVFFAPGGDRIFFREPVKPKKPEDGETSRLVSVRLDGTDKKALLGLPVLSEAVPSPDARWVAFTSRDNVYVAPLPALQLDEPPSVSLEDGAVPVWRLSENAGSFVRWSDDSSALTWIQGRTFHRLELKDVLGFAAKQRAEKKDDKGKDDEGGLKVPASESFDIAVSLPRPQPQGSLLLTNARVVTMKGDEVLQHADVLVTGSRIAAVGDHGALKAPGDAHVVDVAGATIVPGLVDTHAHLHYSGFEVFPDTKWEYVANLAYGVTTVYDPSAPSLDTFEQGEMVEAGLTLGPRITSSGDVLYGGRAEDIYAKVSSYDDALRQVRRMKAYGARMIKVYQQGKRSQRAWFAEACRKEGMLLTAEGAGELMTDMTMTLDGYTAWEHALPIEPYDDVVQLVARTGTHYTPTLLVAYGGPAGESWFWQNESPHDDAKLNRFTPHMMLDRLGRRRAWVSPDEYHFPAVARGVARVMRAGGHVSLGAHGQLQGLGPLWELWAMAGAGDTTGNRGAYLAPLEAIRASTLMAADKIGFAQDIGSVEAGKRADLLICEGDPTSDLRALGRARYVVRDGRLYDASTLREEWPEQRELPEFFWRRGGR